MNEDDREKWVKRAARCPDPVPTVFRPDSNFGSITETIDNMIESYVEAESSKRLLPVKGAQPFNPDEFRVSVNCRMSVDLPRVSASAA